MAITNKMTIGAIATLKIQQKKAKKRRLKPPIYTIYSLLNFRYNPISGKWNPR